MPLQHLLNMIKNGISDNTVLTEQTKETLLKHAAKSLGESDHQLHKDLLKAISTDQKDTKEIVNVDDFNTDSSDKSQTASTSNNALTINSGDLNFDDSPATLPYNDMSNTNTDNNQASNEATPPTDASAN